jgi:hypothetical protein
MMLNCKKIGNNDYKKDQIRNSVAILEGRLERQKHMTTAKLERKRAYF